MELEATQVLDATQIIDTDDGSDEVVGYLEINDIKYKVLVDDTRIGRDPEGEIVLNSPSVSKKHAVIEADRGGAVVMDLGSSNGSKHGTIKMRPDRRYVLKSGDKLTFGQVTATWYEGQVTTVEDDTDCDSDMSDNLLDGSDENQTFQDENQPPNFVPETPLFVKKPDIALHRLSVGDLSFVPESQSSPLPTSLLKQQNLNLFKIPDSPASGLDDSSFLAPSQQAVVPRERPSKVISRSETGGQSSIGVVQQERSTIPAVVVSSVPDSDEDDEDMFVVATQAVDETADETIENEENNKSKNYENHKTKEKDKIMSRLDTGKTGRIPSDRDMFGGEESFDDSVSTMAVDSPKDLIFNADTQAPESITNMAPLAPESSMNIEAKEPDSLLNLETQAPDSLLNIETQAPDSFLNLETQAPDSFLNYETQAPESMLNFETQAPESMLNFETQAPESMLNIETQAPESMLNLETRATNLMLNLETQETDSMLSLETQAHGFQRQDSLLDLETQAPESLLKQDTIIIRDSQAPDSILNKDTPTPEFLETLNTFGDVKRPELAVNFPETANYPVKSHQPVSDSDDEFLAQTQAGITYDSPIVVGETALLHASYRSANPDTIQEVSSALTDSLLAPTQAVNQAHTDPPLAPTHAVYLGLTDSLLAPTQAVATNLTDSLLAPTQPIAPLLGDSLLTASTQAVNLGDSIVSTPGLADSLLAAPTQVVTSVLSDSLLLPTQPVRNVPSTPSQVHGVTPLSDSFAHGKWSSNVTLNNIPDVSPEDDAASDVSDNLLDEEYNDNIEEDDEPSDKTEVSTTEKLSMETDDIKERPDLEDIMDQTSTVDSTIISNPNDTKEKIQEFENSFLSKTSLIPKGKLAKLSKTVSFKNKTNVNSVTMDQTSTIDSTIQSDQEEINKNTDIDDTDVEYDDTIRMSQYVQPAKRSTVSSRPSQMSQTVSFKNKTNINSLTMDQTSTVDSDIVTSTVELSDNDEDININTSTVGQVGGEEADKQLPNDLVGVNGSPVFKKSQSFSSQEIGSSITSAFISRSICLQLESSVDSSPVIRKGTVDYLKSTDLLPAAVDSPIYRRDSHKKNCTVSQLHQTSNESGTSISSKDQLSEDTVKSKISSDSKNKSNDVLMCQESNAKNGHSITVKRRSINRLALSRRSNIEPVKDKVVEVPKEIVACEVTPSKDNKDCPDSGPLLPETQALTIEDEKISDDELYSDLDDFNHDISKTNLKVEKPTDDHSVNNKEECGSVKTNKASDNPVLGRGGRVKKPTEKAFNKKQSDQNSARRKSRHSLGKDVKKDAVESSKEGSNDSLVIKESEKDIKTQLFLPASSNNENDTIYNDKDLVKKPRRNIGRKSKAKPMSKELEHAETQPFQLLVDQKPILEKESNTEEATQLFVPTDNKDEKDEESDIDTMPLIGNNLAGGDKDSSKQKRKSVQGIEFSTKLNRRQSNVPQVTTSTEANTTKLNRRQSNALQVQNSTEDGKETNTTVVGSNKNRGRRLKMPSNLVLDSPSTDHVYVEEAKHLTPPHFRVSLENNIEETKLKVTLKTKGNKKGKKLLESKIPKVESRVSLDAFTPRSKTRMIPEDASGVEMIITAKETEVFKVGRLSISTAILKEKADEPKSLDKPSIVAQGVEIKITAKDLFNCMTYSEDLNGENKKIKEGRGARRSVATISESVKVRSLSKGEQRRTESTAVDTEVTEENTSNMEKKTNRNKRKANSEEKKKSKEESPEESSRPKRRRGIEVPKIDQIDQIAQINSNPISENTNNSKSVIVEAQKIRGSKRDQRKSKFPPVVSTNDEISVKEAPEKGKKEIANNEEACNNTDVIEKIHSTDSIDSEEPKRGQRKRKISNSEANQVLTTDDASLSPEEPSRKTKRGEKSKTEIDHIIIDKETTGGRKSRRSSIQASNDIKKINPSKLQDIKENVKLSQTEDNLSDELPTSSTNNKKETKTRGGRSRKSVVEPVVKPVKKIKDPIEKDNVKMDTERFVEMRNSTDETKTREGHSRKSVDEPVVVPENKGKDKSKQDNIEVVHNTETDSMNDNVDTEEIVNGPCIEASEQDDSIIVSSEPRAAKFKRSKKSALSATAPAATLPPSKKGGKSANVNKTDSKAATTKDKATKDTETKHSSNIADTRKDKSRQSESFNESIDGNKRKQSTSEVSSNGGNVRSRLSTSIDCGSPSLRKVESLSKSRRVIMFTGYNDTSDVSLVKGLGGDTTENLSECSVLVTDKIRRTVKFLSMVGRGVPIVSPSWLAKSSVSGRFLDPWQFVLKDSISEKKFGFKLEETLKKAAEARLLAGIFIHVTPQVQPSPDMCKEVIECSGGEFVEDLPLEPKPNLYVISCPEDKSIANKLSKIKIPVMDKEFLLSGLLKYELDITIKMK